MKGWAIFLHSIRQVTGNLEGAARVSALPFAIQVLAGWLLLGKAINAIGHDPQAMMQMMGPGFFLKLLILMGIAIVTSVWTAVAWHRHVLLGETQTGWVPAFDRSRSWRYFLRSLALGLLTFFIGLVIGFVVGLILTPILASIAPNPWLIGVVLGACIFIPMLTVSYRLCTGLPAMALDKDQAFGAGWEATKGQTAPIALLAVLCVALYAAANLLITDVLGGLPLIGQLADIPMQWLIMMFTISILTTLYGHYIEGRAID